MSWSPSNIAKNPWTRRFTYLLIYLVLALVVVGIFVHVPGINGYEAAMFGDMIYGRAYKPFVYRALLPVTARLVTATIPSETREFLTEHIKREGGVIHNIYSLLFFFYLPWNDEYLVEYAVAFVLLYLSLLGFVFALRFLCTGVFHASSPFTDMVPVLALLALPANFKSYSYLYDFPTLFLFTLGLGLMVRAKWWAFICVFFLACVNKETTILLTMIFVIHLFNNKKMGRLLFSGLLLLQLAIFLCVKGALFYIFRENPGSFVEFHLLDHNLERLLRPYSTSTAFAWIAIAILVFYKWSDKPEFLKQGLWIAVPLFLLTFLFGVIGELRNCYELYPIVILLLAHSVGDVFGIKAIRREEYPIDTA